LVEVAQKADPPVCKIMDYGKYLYREQKKEQKQKSKTGTLKIIKFKSVIKISPQKRIPCKYSGIGN